ncbi:MAG: hypothetical protein KAH77_08420 [Thiomargarita sp.]|nr:hypothetical protein [Thiomargarita sp.]
MLNGIRQKAIVGKGGHIEIFSPELPIGTTVDIIVLMSPQKERWLDLSAHDKQLVQARKEFATEQWIELEENEELDSLLKK